MNDADEKIEHQFEKSLENASRSEKPYRHWLLSDVFPPSTIAELQALPLKHFSLEGISGRRELHNKTRTYLDKENNSRFPVCRSISSFFNKPETARTIERYFQTDLNGSNLRIEFAQDSDGFWLEPHTDIGVKLFTMLVYLSDEPGHERLGTDIYASPDKHVGATPFAPGLATVFIPAEDTWHGFEKRPITGIRKSLIINYVKPEWRAREQLAFPDLPVQTR